MSLLRIAARSSARSKNLPSVFARSYSGSKDQVDHFVSGWDADVDKYKDTDDRRLQLRTASDAELEDSGLFGRICPVKARPQFCLPVSGSTFRMGAPVAVSIFQT